MVTLLSKRFSMKTNAVNVTRDTDKVVKSPWWASKKKAKNLELYHEGLAHYIKDIILGIDHASHSQKRKRAVKALQNPETAQGIVNFLKAMPEPQLPIIEAVNVMLTNSSTSVKGSTTTEIQTSPNPKEVDPPQTSESITSWFFWRKSTQVEAQNEPKDNSPVVSPDNSLATEGQSKDTNSSLIVKTIDKLLTFHPPLDQISAYIFWWGYEIYVPNQCMGRLDQAQNVSNSFLGLLQVVAGSVGPLHPYFGIISAWVGLQFTLIKSQNAGHGVVLAATWILPIALIPRSWDAPIE